MKLKLTFFTILAVAIFVGVGGLYYLNKGNTLYTQQSGKDVKIIYSKQTGSQTHTIYKSDISGTNKTELFKIDSLDKGSLPESAFKIVKERNIILVGLGSNLAGYDIDTGKRQSFFVGVKGKDKVFNYAVSHDNKKVAVNVSNGEYSAGQPNFSSYKIIIIDLEKGTQQTILSKSTSKNEYGGTSFQPSFWSTDDKKIYLTILENEFTSTLWIMNEDGSGLKKLHLPWGCRESNNHHWLACTDLAKPGSKLDSGGISPGYTLKLYDLTTEKLITINEDEDKRFGIERWSFDSQQFLFSEESYKQNQLGSAEFYPPDYYIYDVETGKTQKVTSKDDQVERWYPNELKIDIDMMGAGVDQERDSGRKLVINGKVIDEAQAPRSIDPDTQEKYNITFIGQSFKN